MSQLTQQNVVPNQSPLLTPSPPKLQPPVPSSVQETSPEISIRPPSRSAVPPRHRSPHAHGQGHSHHGGHVKARIGGRTHSHKSLVNVGLGINTDHKAQQSSSHMAPSSSSVPRRPSAVRLNSKSPISPTMASPQARLNIVKRNTSGFVVPRTNTQSVLKKNHSDRHLPRHGSSKNVSKTGKPAAPPMRRTQSSKSVTSNKSHKSDKSTGERQQHPTVRFDLGDDDDAAADDMEDVGDGEEGDEWTDSTSMSPATTRDHTRQNSIILGHAMNASPARQTSSLNQETRPAESPTVEQGKSEPTSVRKNAASHSTLTPDAITSRLLMRAPSAQQLTPVSATAVGSSALANNLSNSQISNEAASSSGGGTSLVSRFLAGGNSHVATPELLNQAVESRIETKEGGSDSDSRGTSLDQHRRNKSTPNVLSMKSTSRNTTPTMLPPSRTSQKLQLQRASTLAEPSRKIPILPSRSTAPLLLSSVNNNFGLGEGEGGAINVHYQGLYSQIDKDYAVIRRFRRPVEEAIARLDRRSPGNLTADAKAKGKAPAYSRSASQVASAAPVKSQKPKQNGGDDLRVHKTSHQSQQPQQQQQQPEIRAPQHLNARRSRVSFEIPSAQQIVTQVDEDQEIQQQQQYGANGALLTQISEVAQICRRMWDLSSVSEPVTFG